MLHTQKMKNACNNNIIFWIMWREETIWKTWHKWGDKTKWILRNNVDGLDWITPGYERIKWVPPVNMTLSIWVSRQTDICLIVKKLLCYVSHSVNITFKMMVPGIWHCHRLFEMHQTLFLFLLLFQNFHNKYFSHYFRECLLSFSSNSFVFPSGIYKCKE